MPKTHQHMEKTVSKQQQFKKYFNTLQPYKKLKIICCSQNLLKQTNSKKLV